MFDDKEIKEIAEYHDALALRDASITIKLSSTFLNRINSIAERDGMTPEQWALMALEYTMAQEPM